MPTRLNALLHQPEALRVIDSHTCGQPTRVVIDGARLPAGTDPLVARDILSRQDDRIRRMVVLEPRGHRSIFGVVLIAPASAGDPWGLVYMDANGYPDMCGHATIGAVTTLFEAGLLRPAQPDLTGIEALTLRAPVGLLEVDVRFEAGRCVAVAFRTPLAYFLGSQQITMADAQTCTVDLAWGGQWYAYLPAEAFGLSIAPQEIDRLIAAAAPVRAALAAQLTLVDPASGRVPEVGNIVWTGPADNPAAHARNVPISSAGSFDRSPCGTATCARMAVLAAHDRLAVGEPFVNQGLIGTLYYGRLIAPVESNAVSGFVPQVEGSAWLTGQSTLFRDPHDPLAGGFYV